VDENTAAANLVDRVDEDGNPFIIHATGPGEQEAQTLLSDLGLGSAILIPIARSNIHNVLVAGRDAAVSQFRGADLELFFVLARQAVVAMENARLYAELREYVRRVEESQQALLQRREDGGRGQAHRLHRA
jgi:GAF domain-containing protein